MDIFFPLTKTKKKSSEDPWVNEAIRTQRKKNKALFLKEGRTEEWRRLNKETNDLEEDRRRFYKEEQKKGLTATGASQQFYSLVKNNKNAEKESPFDRKDLSPGGNE